MIIKSVNLETVVGITSTLPENTLPEFAFAGKSNVGKSSLINAVMNRKAYARVSGEPGKTQTINYYNINNELYLVDLPGYGYAKVSQSTKEKWGKMIEKYLKRSRMLKNVFLLVDIRHEPSENDKMMYDWVVQTCFEPIVIATKADKIKRSQIQKQCRIIREGLGMSKEGKLITFSAETKQGLEEIYSLLEEKKPEYDH
ncbi:MAG: YihA family ribosome biogenesis GTP-binding protein [Lachnospiraceae bacterium]|nr:YihA family ribosome biogenesis GTP-binding protein [Lachnospiraceae bacterium]